MLADDFVRRGFIHLPAAFPQDLAAECRAILWRDTGCDPDRRDTWTRPVVRLGDHAQEPFRQAANTPALHEAFDLLMGPGRWLPRTSLGTFPVRFPSLDDPGDTGWHADAGFAGEDGSWRVNVQSRGRALLMLFLFSDIAECDGPTRILIGSHLDVPAILAPFGDAGLTYIELAQSLPASTFQRPVALATGQAGDVYLCHPFLVHAAQANRGRTARFLAQPPLYPAEPLRLHRPDRAYSPVEQAMRHGLDTSPVRT
jgi:hypothetical protein